MIKQLAWNTFKKTGNIDTFMELTRVNDIEKDLKKGNYEISKNKGNSN